MTLESTQNFNRYIGNGSATDFAFSFKVWEPDQVAVVVGDGETEQDVSASCSIVLTDTGGTVTFPEAPADGTVIVIRRSMPYTQEDNYVNGTRFDAEEVEDRLDQDCAERQDLRLDIDRAVKVPLTSSENGEDFVSSIFQARDDAQEALDSLGGVEAIMQARDDVDEAMRTAGEVTGATRIAASGATTLRSLSERCTDIVNVKDFGAEGDGSNNDTTPWSNWLSASGGMKYAPAGTYKVNGTNISLPDGFVGKYGFTTVLDSADYQKNNFRPTNKGVEKAAINVSRQTTAAAGIGPIIAVEQSISDSTSGSSTLVGYPAGIYSYVEQNGSSTTAAPKAICGATTNAAAGDNDSTAVVGYSVKVDKTGGVGDACGVGGVAWQYSQKEGMVIGGEFSCHQQVSGTSAANYMQDGNNSMSVHVSCNSTGARTFAGIALDTFSLQPGKYGFWNAILFGRSCFASTPNTSGAAPTVEAGTVGLNFAGCTSIYPEKETFHGNAHWHEYRNTASIRHHCGSFDIENQSGQSVFLRLVNDSSNSCYIGGYTGTLGADGDTSLDGRGEIQFAPSGTIYFKSGSTEVALSTITEDNTTTKQFYPNGTTNTVSLGTSSHAWKDVFVGNPAVNLSDERMKTSIDGIPDEVLDAWGDVHWLQFQMLEAVEEKGADNARLHSGLIAQRINAAFEARGLDARRYGLLCYDEWAAVPETVSIEREIVSPAQYDSEDNLIAEEVVREIEHRTPGLEAGSRWSVRYGEALSMEAAFQRRRADRLEARIEQLESLVSQLVNSN